MRPRISCSDEWSSLCRNLLGSVSLYMVVGALFGQERGFLQFMQGRCSVVKPRTHTR